MTRTDNAPPRAEQTFLFCRVDMRDKRSWLWTPCYTYRLCLQRMTLACRRANAAPPAFPVVVAGVP